MRAILAGFLMGVLVVAQAHAQNWYEPALGSAERAALMDAARPHAEIALGAPVEFVVSELRVSGDLAFAMLTAQRPGGVPIDLTQTPGFRRGEFYLEVEDPTSIQVLYKRSGSVWVAVHPVLGATDVWWIAPDLCREFYPVIADYCR